MRAVASIYSCSPCVELEDGSCISFSSSVKSLGVIIDSRLDWSAHVDTLSIKCNRVLYCLRFFRKYTNESLRKRLAEALVFPILDYCSTIYLDASLDIRRRLQVLQNSCARYVSGASRREHITPVRERLGWLKIDSRRNYFLSVCMYKILRIGKPSYLLSLFTKCQPGAPRRGTSHELVVPLMRSGVGHGSFQVRGAILWNALPPSLRNLPSLSRFKSAARIHFTDLD